MHTILVPIDFTQTSYTAFLYAVQLANLVYGRLKLIHIVPSPIVETYGFTASPPPLTIEEQEEKMALFDEWERKIPSKLKRNIEIIPNLLFGNIDEEIIDQIQKNPPSLMVMGKKRESSMGNYLFGGIIRKVLPEVSCPLLIVPSETKYQTIRDISFGTKFEDQNQLVIERLMEFPFLTEAKIHCVHVGNGGVLTQSAFASGLGELKEKFNRDVDFHTIKVNNPGSSQIVEELLHFAEARNMQMMALIVQSKGFWGKLFRESVVHRLSNHTSIPLLLFNVN